MQGIGWAQVLGLDQQPDGGQPQVSGWGAVDTRHKSSRQGRGKNQQSGWDLHQAK